MVTFGINGGAPAVSNEQDAASEMVPSWGSGRCAVGRASVTRSVGSVETGGSCWGHNTGNAAEKGVAAKGAG